MKTLESLPTRQLTGDELTAARKQWEIPRRSPWASDQSKKKRRSPSLLPICYGDGLQPVLVSFYAAPEVMIVVLFDSALPLDLNEDERFKESDELRSFRDITDHIFDSCEDQWSDPPNAGDYRMAQLREEAEDDEFDDFWSLLERDGCTWCHA